MQPEEIAARVEERLKRDLARNRLEGWARYAADGPPPALPGLKEAVLNNGSRVAALAAAQAAEVRQGRFKALGVAWPQRAADALFEPELWRLDPVTGGLWPGAEQYCFDISYRHERTLGDIKYVWEINRLQFLQVLAVDALVNGSAASVAVAEAAIHSWCDANPPFRGLGWNSGIELALRAISLLVVSSLCGERLSDDANRKLRAALHAHLVWIDRYPSRFSSANNHLVAEAAGQFLIALAMPELPGAEAHLRKARRTLEAEALKQVLADGVGAEQSPTYGAFTVEFVLLCAAAAHAAGQPLERTAVERLAAFARYIAWIAESDGRTPAIGDDDEGRVLTSGQEEQTYAVSVARAVLGVCGSADPGLPAAAPELRDAVFSSPQAIVSPPEGVTTFAEGGYSVVRERRLGRDLALVLDHGPLGYLSIAAHGHADALAFTLDLDGRRVLVDPGTYLYHSGGAWRDWFRGTRAHNTLALSDADQSVITGAFNWGRKATAVLEEAIAGPDWSLTASHDGYVSTQAVVHRRTVRAVPEGIELHDRLEPASSAHATVTFQFAPEVEAIRNGDAVDALIQGKPVLALEFDAPGDLSLSLGGPLEQGGWVSPSFGVKIEAPVVRWHGPIPPSGLRTIIKLR